MDEEVLNNNIQCVVGAYVHIYIHMFPGEKGWESLLLLQNMDDQIFVPIDTPNSLGYTYRILQVLIWWLDCHHQSFSMFD
jgi:hypothetical protein